jgi:proline iminopeptidase
MFRSHDPADDFNLDVYLGFMGTDPEWKVGGTMKGYDPSPLMRRMTTPTLICVGRFDRVAMPSIASEINRLIRGSRLVVFEKSSHRPWIEEMTKWVSS